MRPGPAILAILLFAVTLPVAAKWRLHVDKKASQITGARNTRAETTAKKGSVILLVGCTDTKPIVRIAQSFRIANAVNDALTKSPLERAVDKSQRYGFQLFVRDGKYYSQVKLRFGDAADYMEFETPAGYNDGVYFLILDDKESELLSKMKTDHTLFVQLAYKTGTVIVEFAMDGLEESLEVMAEAGCRL